MSNPRLIVAAYLLFAVVCGFVLALIGASQVVVWIVLAVLVTGAVVLVLRRTRGPQQRD